MGRLWAMRTKNQKPSDRAAQAGRSFGFGDLLIAALSVALLAAFVFPPRPTVEPLPDFRPLNPQERKLSFFSYLSPIVAEVNDRARAERDRVQSLREAIERGASLPWFDRRWLRRLAERLEVPIDDVPTQEQLEMLTRRTGAVPESLVLVQAAKESGWGTSRFAVQGNNLFGQRCYSPGCGIVPTERAPSARFGVAAFDSVQGSVEGYVLNLNTHPQYADFRVLRQQLREAGRPVTGLSLVDSLDGYSERGREYVAEIRALIRQNGLE